MRRPLPLLLALLFLLLPSLASAQTSLSDGPVHLRLLPGPEPLTPGSSASLLLQLSFDPKFHVQSAAPHDKNFIATVVTLDPAPGITPGPVRYPIATELPVPKGVPGPPTVAIYDHTCFIRIPLTLAADLAPGPLTLHLAITTQACDDKACQMPTTDNLSIPLTILAPGASPPARPPEELPLLAAAATQSYMDPLPPKPTASAPATIPTTATPIADQLALIASRPYTPSNSQEHSHSLPFLLLSALLGGIILNVMPCVLPVIPLKVIGLVQQAHGDRRHALLHALSFSAGIITLFIALALLLKTAGLFYGQQFQSPAFLITMACLVTAFALSMLSVWTISPPQALYNLTPTFQDPNAPRLQDSRTPHAHLASFTNGLLATLLATPCSAPFLGPVLAWALTQSTLTAALFLALVGVGMSLPYLLLAAFPQLLSKVPRAGRWSELLKQALGIVMIGVALYLITLLPNIALWPFALFAALLTALVCWAWGQLPTFSMSRARIWTIRSISLALGLALAIPLTLLANRAAAAPPPGEGADWIPFDIAALDAALADHRPVIVDWTANWCLNCHVLEALVLDAPAIRKTFADSHALLLRADLSSNNPPASALYTKLGGHSIPGLAIFSPSHPTTPTLLTDSYTQSRLITELSQANR